MENVERTEKRPRKDKLAVEGHGAINGKAMRATENPIGDVTAAVGQEESKTDAVKCFVDAHMAGSGGGVICRENVATK